MAGPRAEDSGDFRAGFCPVVGLPNVGKSTLVNALVGTKLCIVTPRAQTTRRPVRALYTDERHQAVFVDTPGLIEPRSPLQEAMLDEGTAALRGADVVLYVVDAGYRPSVEAGRHFELPPRARGILCLNKADRIGAEECASLRGTFAGERWEAVVPAVATEGEGVAELRAEILERLPPSPPYYPPDDLAAAPLRFFVGELVRETCFEELAEEVPYAVAVEVREFRADEEPAYLSANIHVERRSQKGIVVGKGGRMIRRIGARSREKIEELLGRHVYLDLWVKVLPKWRKKRDALARLGFRVGEGP